MIDTGNAYKIWVGKLGKMRSLKDLVMNGTILLK
jgi:hypothetical protein